MGKLNLSLYILLLLNSIHLHATYTFIYRRSILRLNGYHFWLVRIHFRWLLLLLLLFSLSFNLVSDLIMMDSFGLFFFSSLFRSVWWSKVVCVCVCGIDATLFTVKKKREKKESPADISSKVDSFFFFVFGYYSIHLSEPHVALVCVCVCVDWFFRFWFYFKHTHTSCGFCYYLGFFVVVVD